MADVNSSSALVRVSLIAVNTAQQFSLDLSGSPRLAEFELPSSQATWNTLNVNLALSAVRTETVQEWIGALLSSWLFSRFSDLFFVFAVWIVIFRVSRQEFPAVGGRMPVCCAQGFEETAALVGHAADRTTLALNARK